jgi:hypothetical protein
VYSINATFVTSCNTTNVRALDVIVPRPSTNINTKRISITRIYFAFFGGSRNDRLNDFVMLIYIYNNAMRSCNERTTLHCVESYLYYVILVKKYFRRSETREKKNKQYNYIHCRKYKIYDIRVLTSFSYLFRSEWKWIIYFRKCTYIVSIVLFQKPQRNCQIV